MMAAKQKVKELKLQVVELRADGLPYQQIAERLGVDIQEAIDLAEEEPDRVATLRAVKMEALFETGRVNTKGRIEQLSTLRNRLLEEIERRDLADVPTDKLIALFLKSTDAIKGEVFTPEIRSTEQQAKDEKQRSMLNIGW